MKRAWRCLVGWLLVGLIVLQLPMTALADEIVPIEVEEAAEPLLSETETGQIDEDAPAMYQKDWKLPRRRNRRPLRI